MPEPNPVRGVHGCTFGPKWLVVQHPLGAWLLDLRRLELELCAGVTRQRLIGAPPCNRHRRYGQGGEAARLAG